MSPGLHADIAARRGEFSLELEFSLAPGATAAVLGPNGAGKSTLVDALAGLVPLTRGEVVLGGRALERPGERLRLTPQERGLGVMFQGYCLFGHMSARDNVAYGLRARGVGRARARAEAQAWLERLGVAEVGELRPAALSGGQAQRVALARAMITRPALLLLDEPLAALDVSARAQARRLLAGWLAEAGAISLIVSHDVRDAVALADELLVVEGGRLTARGTAAELRARPPTAYVAAVLAEDA
ncbi:ABC transporter ATP-binding protein [Nannocystis pusilla]|uniref:ATP-binding cassette domain-containing protein n=1 Tax=Nannocystis pusilla TaxID=889268 RepID=A0ABS7TYU7_9BACT|nr:ATP-binding cassette domain-containing protein [Nannocystis pusilla]MBZ5713453.1 ATP-binding cassette domain-containing protein [Nannocystis pusilla]